MAAAAHAKPNHDYHLVNPSPWPIVGSVSALILAIGAIAFFKSRKGEALMLFGGDLAVVGPWVMLIGFAGVLYTMLSWWMDVIKEAEYEGYHTRVVQISHRYGMISSSPPR